MTSIPSRPLAALYSGVISAFAFGLIAWFVLPATFEGIASVPSPESSTAILVATLLGWLLAPALAAFRPGPLAELSAAPLGLVLGIGFGVMLLAATGLGGMRIGGTLDLIATLGACCLYGELLAFNTAALHAQA